MNKMMAQQPINSGRRERAGVNNTTLRSEANNSSVNRGLVKKTVSPTNESGYVPSATINTSL